MISIINPDLPLLSSFRVQKTSDDPKKLCLAARDDYLECLHHKKELMRNLAIQEEAARQAAGGEFGGHGGSGH